MRQITEIKKVGKGDRYHLFVDNEFFGTFEAEILAKNYLKTNCFYDDEFLEKIKIENGDYACFNRALSLLEKTMKTEKMLFDYLKEKRYPEECIIRAIKKVKEYGYINDEQFCESYINSYCKLKSKRKLKYDLINKGVNEELINKKLEEIINDDDELENCYNLAKKYMKNKSFDIKTKRKFFNHLIIKGFDYSIITKAWEGIANDRN